MSLSARGCSRSVNCSPPFLPLHTRAASAARRAENAAPRALKCVVAPVQPSGGARGGSSSAARDGLRQSGVAAARIAAGERKLQRAALGEQHAEALGACDGGV